MKNASISIGKIINQTKPMCVLFDNQELQVYLKKRVLNTGNLIVHVKQGGSKIKNWETKQGKGGVIDNLVIILVH